MNALEHLAIAETALMYGQQTTASWVAIENIRSARDWLLRSNSAMPDQEQATRRQIDEDPGSSPASACWRGREHTETQ